MRKYFFRFTVFVFVSSLVGCGFLSRREKSEGFSLDPQVVSYLDKKLADAERKLDLEKLNEAEKDFAQYVQEWTHTLYLNRAKIGLAKTYYMQGRPDLAVPILNEVIEYSSRRYPEITALASFQLYFNYDLLANDAKSLAALKDTESLAGYISPSLSEAEVPARLAAYYRQKGEEGLARQYFKKAEQGIARIFKGNNSVARAEKARTYLLMGRLNTSQVDEENFSRQVNSLSITQIFLLRAIEADADQWSGLATKELMQNYSDLWNSILGFSKKSNQDDVIAQSEYNEHRIEAINQILEKIEQLKTYHMTENKSVNAQRLFLFLEKMRQNGEQVVLATSSKSPITSEAQGRQSLRKNFKIKSEPLFENEIQKDQVKSTTDKTDPNLE